MYDPIETGGAGGLATPRVDGLERPDLLRDRAYVGGAWCDAGDGRRLAVADPADGSPDRHRARHGRARGAAGASRPPRGPSRPGAPRRPGSAARSCAAGPG